jgi:hypothetical protein
MNVEALKDKCKAMIEDNSIVGIMTEAYNEEELKYIVNSLGDDVDSVCICPEETFMSSEDFLDNYKKEKGDERLYLLNTNKFIK